MSRLYRAKRDILMLELADHCACACCERPPTTICHDDYWMAFCECRDKWMTGYGDTPEDAILEWAEYCGQLLGITPAMLVDPVTQRTYRNALEDEVGRAALAGGTIEIAGVTVEVIC